MLKKRQYEVRKKGFNISEDYSNLRVGIKEVKNALVDVNTYKRVDRRYGDKTFVLQSISKRDFIAMREISRFFFQSNGIYKELCQYLATLYRYDWYVTPYIDKINNQSQNKILGDFSKVLLYLDRSEVKKICTNIALDIIVDGAYYGIIVDFGDSFGIQKLPPEYCRSRYFSGAAPVVELNLQFFDSFFPNPQYKVKILKAFPEEIQRAYILFKQGKLKGDYPGDTTFWVALDPGTSVKLSLSDFGDDYPTLIGVIPSIIDLDEAQELDRKKTMQQLLKIIVQKLPLDKNGDLIFDVDEARDIHNNAVTMLRKAIGVDVLTTFADIEKIDTKDSNSQTTTDDLEKVERTVYNNSGVSHNLFNADGNIATANSILADEAKMRTLPMAFETLLNKAIAKFNRKNHYEFRVEILETTQFNYQELSKMYKEQAQLGYSKMLPQVALGHSQASILATLTFENNVLHLADIMIPPMSSNTRSGKDLGTSNQSNQTKNQSNTEGAGRPALAEDEKSDKTIANQESA